jgi:hypothetical protein
MFKNKYKGDFNLEKTFKNYEILDIANALKQLINIKLPFKASWNISKNVRKFDEALKNYWEFENKLANEYAIKDDKGLKFGEDGFLMFPPNNKDKYNKEHSELLNCEDTIDILPINSSDFTGTEIEPSLLLKLDFMISDDGNESE